MSEALNDVFIDNFQKDPTLTWQYFGSATGFFRLYPGDILHALQNVLICPASARCWDNMNRAVDKHPATQATYTATDNAGSCLSNVMTQSQLQCEFSPVCVCVISRGFVTQLVLLICHLIHLSLIWQSVTIHPCVHLFIRPGSQAALHL